LNILQRKHCDDFGMLQQRHREEAESKAKERGRQELTAEEILAEKLQQQKLQEESDLRVAMETFGVSHSFFSIF
jgi:translation initiation factor 3 subunit J